MRQRSAYISYNRYKDKGLRDGVCIGPVYRIENKPRAQSRVVPSASPREGPLCAVHHSVGGGAARDMAGGGGWLQRVPKIDRAMARARSWRGRDPSR